MKFPCLSLLLLFVLGFIEIRAQHCNRWSARKEVRDLTRREWNDFVDAVRQLHYKSSSSSPSAYDEFTRIHLEYRHEIHL